jgi:hypothetical protein
MEERASGEAGQTALGRRELVALAVLFVVAAGIRVWIFSHTEVASRDSIAFNRIAWQLRHGDSWAQTVREAEHHPGYPFLVMLASYAIDLFYRGPDSIGMQYAAQLASCAAGTLLVLPMYFLGRRLFDARTAFWACLLFQCLPSGGRNMSDGLSEATYLLWVTSSLYFAVLALERRSVLLYAVSGVFAALAYLTRLEGLLLLPSVGFVLLLVQSVPAWRGSWRTVIACGGALVVAGVVTASPFNITIRGITNKPSERYWMGEVGTPGKSAPTVQRPVVSASVFGDWIDPSNEHSRLWWATKTLGTRLFKGFFYVAWLPALLGLWLYRARLRASPDAWVVAIFCGAFTLVLVRHTAMAGYLSDRHCIALILFGCYLAAYAGLAIAAAVTRLPALARVGPALPLAILAVLPVVGLVRTLTPLHDERTGFKEVGLWLADHTTRADFVLDPYSWANYYSGRVFTDPSIHPMPSPGRQWYIVLEDAQNAHPRLGWHRMAVKVVKDTNARPVYRQPVRRDKGDGEIVVYSVFMPPKP